MFNISNDFKSISPILVDAHFVQNNCRVKLNRQTEHFTNSLIRSILDWLLGFKFFFYGNFRIANSSKNNFRRNLFAIKICMFCNEWKLFIERKRSFYIHHQIFIKCVKYLTCSLLSVCARARANSLGLFTL